MCLRLAAKNEAQYWSHLILKTTISALQEATLK